MSDLIIVNDDTFDSEVLGSEKPVLVKFGANWCSPCLRQLPILEKFAKENPSSVKVCDIDVDDSPKISAKFNIRSIPTLMLFMNGSLVGTKSGSSSYADIVSFVYTDVEKKDENT